MKAHRGQMAGSVCFCFFGERLGGFVLKSQTVYGIMKKARFLAADAAV